jgi:hypothetical protein
MFNNDNTYNQQIETSQLIDAFKQSHKDHAQGYDAMTDLSESMKNMASLSMAFISNNSSSQGESSYNGGNTSRTSVDTDTSSDSLESISITVDQSNEVLENIDSSMDTLISSLRDYQDSQESDDKGDSNEESQLRMNENTRINNEILDRDILATRHDEILVALKGRVLNNNSSDVRDLGDRDESKSAGLVSAFLKKVPFVKLAKTLGKLGGQALLVTAAFGVGWEIGRFLDRQLGISDKLSDWMTADSKERTAERELLQQSAKLLQEAHSRQQTNLESASEATGKGRRELVDEIATDEGAENIASYTEKTQRELLKVSLDTYKNNKMLYERAVAVDKTNRAEGIRTRAELDIDKEKLNEIHEKTITAFNNYNRVKSSTIKGDTLASKKSALASMQASINSANRTLASFEADRKDRTTTKMVGGTMTLGGLSGGRAVTTIGAKTREHSLLEDKRKVMLANMEANKKSIDLQESVDVGVDYTTRELETFKSNGVSGELMDVLLKVEAQRSKELAKIRADDIQNIKEIAVNNTTNTQTIVTAMEDNRTSTTTVVKPRSDRPVD